MRRVRIMKALLRSPALSILRGLAFAWPLAAVTCAHAAALPATRDAQTWGPVLVGFIAGIAVSELVRLFFRCLAYGWFSLWLTGRRLLQYGAIGGFVIAVLYFR